MRGQKYLFLILLVSVFSLEAVAGTTIKCDPTKCDLTTLAHYGTGALDCEAVYADGGCCPTSYICVSEEERNLLPDKCYYKGIAYNINDEVPIEKLCQVGCRCRSSRNSNLAQIECVSVECPSLFQGWKPGCRYIYSNDRCCEVDEECGVEPSPVSVRIDTPTCAAEGKTYKLGDKMYFDEIPYKCQSCVCTEDYTSPQGPGCSKVDCGFEFRYRSELYNGGVPIYSSCCSIGFLMPDDESITETQAVIDETKPFCTFGNLKIALGAPLATSNKRTQCACKVPPLPTCRYVSSSN